MGGIGKATDFYMVLPLPCLPWLVAFHGNRDSIVLFRLPPGGWDSVGVKTVCGSTCLEKVDTVALPALPALLALPDALPAAFVEVISQRCP